MFVMTSSNFKPDDLYKDGLQRADFIPFIKYILNNYDVICVDSDTDYRRLTLNQSKTYFTPINNDTEEEFNLLFECRDGQHPIVLRRVFGEEVSLETFIILDSILNFTSNFNEEIEESVMWPNLYSMCNNYAPFVVVNKQKYVDILKKQVELHYA